MRAILASCLLSAAALAAEPAPQGQVLVPRFDIKLPPGWQYQLNPGGPLTWTPKGGDTVGALQVSRINDKDVGGVMRQKELAPYAVEIGSRLGWGKALSSTDGPCEMGRMGMATFTGPEFASMRLWVVVSQHSAYMWTWMGATPRSPEEEQALQMVMEAKETRNPVPPVIAKAIDAAEKASPARAEVNKGKSADTVHLAMLVDAQGKPMNVERPVLSGRLSAAPPGLKLKPNTAAWELRFDSDVGMPLGLALTMGPGTTAKVALARNQTLAPSQKSRLWAAQLWSLVGERIDAPYAAAEFEAQVLGVKLIRTRLPSNFGSPGKGEWLLLKTTAPGEIYIALNLEAGIAEFFPVVPLQPNDGARALFKFL